MTYNVPVRSLQGGSVEETAASGTQLISAGGSIQVASGGIISIASGGSLVVASGASFNAPGGITSGGTFGRFAFGTVGLTAGLGTIATGLTRVISATGNAVLITPSGNGSTTSVQVDLSLSGAGSVIFRSSIGTLPAAVDGTISWAAWGT